MLLGLPLGNVYYETGLSKHNRRVFIYVEASLKNLPQKRLTEKCHKRFNRKFSATK